jgi:hypothetical protein
LNPRSLGYEPNGNNQTSLPRTNFGGCNWIRTNALFTELVYSQLPSTSRPHTLLFYLAPHSGNDPDYTLVNSQAHVHTRVLRNIILMAEDVGFEPTLWESKSHALDQLGESPIILCGAPCLNRTDNLSLTRRLLCQCELTGR